MKRLEAEELLSCLPAGRTLFTYGKDWYAISLLQMALRNAPLADLKNSTLANLFAKPRLRAWLGSFGRKSITAEDLDLLWPEEAETYLLTADLFSGWAQTSRKGNDRWNIVLQLNLNGGDARMMEKKFPDRGDDPFEYGCHPVHEGRHRTLAWARIDVDWNSGEALIEEIQNDRLREVRRAVDWIRKGNRKVVRMNGQMIDAAFVIRYWEHRLRLSRQWWDEAMLCASVRFIAGELGIKRIFYHSPLSGEKLKGDGAKNAPPSLYTDLPKRFCFERTETLPAFIRRRRSLPSDLWMHRMCL